MLTLAQLANLGIDITPRYVLGEDDKTRDGRWCGEVHYLEPGIALTTVALVFGESLEELRQLKMAIRDSLQIRKEVAADMVASVVHTEVEPDGNKDRDARRTGVDVGKRVGTRQ